MGWGLEVIFPANQDLAEILGRTDVYPDKLYFVDFNGWFPDFKILVDPDPTLSASMSRGQLA